MFKFLWSLFSSSLFDKRRSDIGGVLEASQHKEDSGVFYENPKVPWETLEIIDKFALTNPDLSQAVKRIVQLGNTGHDVSFEGLSEAQSKKAKEHLRGFAQRIFKPAAGMDSVVNALIRQVIVKGAVSVEAVPAENFSSLEKIVFVPVKSIRFKKKDGHWVAYQQKTAEERELNENQYMYIPLFQDENSPYGIPPFLPALQMLLTQQQSMKGIRDIIKKFSLLGFIFAKKEKPRSFGLTDSEYKRKAQKELDDFSKAFRQNFSSGTAVAFDDTNIEHHSVTGDVDSTSGLFKIIEEQVASGMDIDPAMLGRNYSTTETYAGVVYGSFLAQLENLRRLLKRVLERIYFLELVLAGFSVKRVFVSFKENKSLKPQEDAQAEQLKISNVIMKLQAGLIDADTAANELGYEKATGATNDGQLTIVNDKLALGEIDMPAVKKKSYELAPAEGDKNEAEKNRLTDEQAQEAWNKQYKKTTRKILSGFEEKLKSTSTPLSDRKVKEAWQWFDEQMKTQLPKELYEAVKSHIVNSWVQGAKVNQGDGKDPKTAVHTASKLLPNAINWFHDDQKYWYGKIYNDYRPEIHAVIMAELGGDPQGKGDELIDKAVEKAGDELMREALTNRYRLVVSTAVNKARNYSQVLAMEELNFQDLEVVAMVDERTSDICRTMNGRRIQISTAANHVRDVLATSPDEITSKFPWKNSIGSGKTSTLVGNMANKLPPYHGRCRTTVIASRPQKLVNRSGQVLRGANLDFSEMTPDQRERWKAYDGLTEAELAAKVKRLRWAKFEKERAQDKFRQHRQDFIDNGGTIDGKKVNPRNAQELEELADQVLKGFDRMFVYYREEKDSIFERVMFYREDANTVTVVDEINGKIFTTYPLRPDVLEDYETDYIEVVP